MSGVEGFDDEHRRATGFAQVNTSAGVLIIDTIIGYIRWYLQQFTSPGQVFAADLVGEQSIVADAVKAIGQDMQEKAPDKLIRGQGQSISKINATFM